MTPPRPLAIIFMGVSGSGKSSLGAAAARALGAPFVEGDALHPHGNLQKLRLGIPLADEDRWPWLDRVAAAVRRETSVHPLVVCSCSALKRSYRDRLRRALDVPILFVCLIADPAILRVRMQMRTGHFMPVSLLEDQLATLEEPEGDEAALVLRNEGTPAALVSRITEFVTAKRGLSAT